MKDIWNSSIKISPSVLHQELGGETVLLNLSNESYFGLDAVGTRVWAMLGKADRLEAVVEQMLAEFDVSAEQLRSDVTKLVEQLIDAGLVSVE